MSIPLSISKAYDGIKKYRRAILAFILSIYSLPYTFYKYPNYSIDGSWIIAVNYAVKRGLVFGRDIIFPYGPFGFLSTRDPELVSGIAMLMGDLFLFTGFFYFIHKYIAGKKGWFFIILLSMLLLRSAIYSQSLFLIFIIYFSLNFRDNFSSRFQLTYCTAAGILLFFIKINYGLVSVFLLLVLFSLLLVKSYKEAIIFIGASATIFFALYCCVHMEIVGYIRFSLPLMEHYDEAMYLIKNPWQTAFVSAICLTIALFAIIAAYGISLLKQRAVNLNKVIYLFCLCLAGFLFYKNGFTRFDFYHYGEFFAIFSFFIIAAVFLCGMQDSVALKITSAAAIMLCGYNLLLPDLQDKSVNISYYMSYLSPAQYLKSVCYREKAISRPLRLLSKNTLNTIGNNTMDILPWEINMTRYYKFNYDQRPIPQSPAYSRTLDSLNARYFCKQSRPEIVMFQNFPTDYRYCFWDESLTKAALRLNYAYEGYAGVNDSNRLEGDPFDTYVMLRSKKNYQAFPKFERISSRVVGLQDTVRFDFPGNDAIYMSVDVKYSFKGKIKRFFYEVPELNVTLFFDDSTTREYRAVLPIIASPVLINKAVIKNSDVKNFFTGNLSQSRNIKAFVFHVASRGFAPKYTVSFWRFSNY